MKSSKIHKNALKKKKKFLIDKEELLSSFYNESNEVFKTVA